MDELPAQADSAEWDCLLLCVMIPRTQYGAYSNTTFGFSAHSHLPFPNIIPPALFFFLFYLFLFLFFRAVTTLRKPGFLKR